MESQAGHLKMIIDLKDVAVKRQEDMRKFYYTNFVLSKTAGPHERETKLNPLTPVTI